MTTRRSSLPVLRLMARLIRVAPGWYLANVFLWTSIWVLPVIPALITQRFFDDLGTAGFNPATLIALMIGYPLVLYFPSHLALRRIFPAAKDS